MLVTQKKRRSDIVVCEKGADKERDMTTKGRAEARIRRAERIVGFVLNVIFPVFSRARESRRAV